MEEGGVIFGRSNTPTAQPTGPAQASHLSHCKRDYKPSSMVDAYYAHERH